ncbi:isoleucine--tRNA ligase [Candidatus Endowatersipora endosymbiont of Watersipora subatra]|uniref:isoleucine--tRNA ligase n=1 Tax=Candidatus Endowatersipora endosymbiont of Watersipora subatra TaxID=3077946 RepID=UPI00312CA12D
MQDRENNVDGRDYSNTLFLPRTTFPMRGNLPKKEIEILSQWENNGLYSQLREDSIGRPKYVLHDGPPYANGHLHMGHALNKILKDFITRSFQMRGYDSNYIPGWDCHGLPIEWKIEEQYRERGKNKDEVDINGFRKECRDFAAYWVAAQMKEFKRLGVIGNFETPYLTMDYEVESIIADELMKFAKSGQLYRGSKPVMWSVVEHTALAEAEIEYKAYESDTIWVEFPVLDFIGQRNDEQSSIKKSDLLHSSVIIWTTTPWTIPGNRAVCFSSHILYSLFEVVSAERDYGPQPGAKLIFSDKLVEECAKKARVTLRRLSDVKKSELLSMTLSHPLAKANLGGYQFKIPMIDGDHVTDDSGTGFVHTAPGHGHDDFEIWMSHLHDLKDRGIDPSIPFTVDSRGFYTGEAPGFEGACVLDTKGNKGDANQKVIKTLIQAKKLFARGSLKHDYPHSWRSQKPIIVRNTPQWFLHMDKEDLTSSPSRTLRSAAIDAIENTLFVPEHGKSRLLKMIENRPDWVLSRQRAWGVPISVFCHYKTGQVIPGPNFIKSGELARRIKSAFSVEGADSWYAVGAKERFLEGIVDDIKNWEKIDDVLDVWFDSGCTHAFCLEQRPDLKWPADLYLEGSDQHRGWFQSSLLESCGTRGRAPYNTVLTHGFTMAENGRKMSKSVGNVVEPQKIISQYGADILRLWVASVDYQEDQRIGSEIIKTSVDAYRKIRNTFRWMLGSLAHDTGEKISYNHLPELERFMLHRLVTLDSIVRKGYDQFDFKRVFVKILKFMNLELSAFYFDIRKDVLYCDSPSSRRRKSALFVISQLFDCLTVWMAPILCFTMEEAWLERYPNIDSVHRRQFPQLPNEWHDKNLENKWHKVRTVRRVVTAALEVERREKRIRSSLEACPIVHITDSELLAALNDLDFAEICITSQIKIVNRPANGRSFSLGEIPNVSVKNQIARGHKCARSWRILPEVGRDPEYPDLSLRDAKAMREIEREKTEG